MFCEPRIEFSCTVCIKNLEYVDTVRNIWNIYLVGSNYPLLAHLAQGISDYIVPANNIFLAILQVQDIGGGIGIECDALCIFFHFCIRYIRVIDAVGIAGGAGEVVEAVVGEVGDVIKGITR